MEIQASCLEILKCTFVMYGLYVTIYITVGLPFLYVDLTGRPKWIRKYKIQRDASIKSGMLSSLFKNQLELLLVQFACGICYSYLLNLRGCDLNVTVPQFTKLPFQILSCALLAEIIFYYTHRILHHPYFYKRVHKKHHEWTAPLGLTAFYAHPFEFLFSNLSTILLPPLIVGCSFSNALVWMLLGSFVTVIHHSGYHLPFLPSPEFHDFHHLKFIGNYGVLGILDRLHGTDSTFRNSLVFQRHKVIFSSKDMLNPLSRSLSSERP